MGKRCNNRRTSITKSSNDYSIFYFKNTRNWNKARHKEVVSVAKDLGLDFVDLNTLTKEVNMDWSKDTRDKGDHLNHFGTIKVTEYLGKYLNDLGIFSDRRSEEAYSSWNSTAEKYNKITAKAMKKALK